MKKLPNEKVLSELLQQAKETEQKARELEQMGVEFERKWSKRLQDNNKIVNSQQSDRTY